MLSAICDETKRFREMGVDNYRLMSIADMESDNDAAKCGVVHDFLGGNSR